VTTPPTEHLQVALDALGLHRNPEDTHAYSAAFLLGSLSAVVESLTHNQVTSGEVHEVHEGFMQVLAATSADDVAAGRSWMVLLGDRLNRTAFELQIASEGDATKAFTDVIGPAMLIAANLVNAMNRGELDQDAIRTTVAMTERNLAKLTDGFDTLKKSLREFGFQLD
jgi:hypothetical protein